MEFPSTIRITATCACQSFRLSVDLQPAALPLPAALCLCNSCRQLSGTCGTCYAGEVRADDLPDPSVLNLTRYETSNGGERWFCSTCGAHALMRATENGPWHLATGLWDRTEGLLKWAGCKSIRETLDGGVSVWLGDVMDQGRKERGLQSLVPHDGDGTSVLGDTLGEFPRPKNDGTGEERLKASCKCGGVKFYITRPTTASKRVRSPFPDLMVPYCTGASPANPENETWWLRDNDTKYMAGLCMCNSCRLASGFEVQTWAFVPRCNIFQEDGREMHYSMGTLKTYPSSDGVWREFCGVCGATVFWHCGERPDLVDVSVGLFNPEEGARVEAWLDWWTERVSFEEMAVSKGLARDLADGLRTWGRERKA